MSVISLFNLVLGMGIIRRLREHTEILSGSGSKEGLTQPEHRIDDIAVATLGGGTFARDTLAGSTLVAFFMPGCAGCKIALPEFISEVGQGRYAGHRVIGVVNGSGEEADALRDQLAALVDTVVPTATRDVIKAFDSSVYPAFYVVDETGTIRQSSTKLAEIDLPVPAVAGN
ncbi:peroxiredoxin family protein [Micromonospora profundi]|uniref:peroxiredoxin family protein n=1 Tax=Micromonospora TaxID=1873 RepID=UPI0033BB7B4A